MGGDKGFDTPEFVAECRHMNVTPHVAQNTGRRGGSAIDAPHHAARRLRRQPEEAQADRGVLRLAEGHRAAAQAETSRTVQGGMDLHLRGGGLQPGADAKADGQPSWCRMSQGRSVPARGESGQKTPQLQALTLSTRVSGRPANRFGIMRVAVLARNRRFSAAC